MFSHELFDSLPNVITINCTGVVFAFVWASFLPPVKRNNYNDDVITELMVQNNNEQPKSMVSN